MVNWVQLAKEGIVDGDFFFLNTASKPMKVKPILYNYKDDFVHRDDRGVIKVISN